jgi:hypothetical protein
MLAVGSIFVVITLDIWYSYLKCLSIASDIIYLITKAIVLNC